MKNLPKKKKPLNTYRQINFRIPMELYRIVLDFQDAKEREQGIKTTAQAIYITAIREYLKQIGKP